jgi:hypothetical protein
LQYEAIKFLATWTGYLLIIVPFAAGAAITYQAIRKAFSLNNDDKLDANKKIIQTIKGAIIAETISGVIQVVKSFYL